MRGAQASTAGVEPAIKSFRPHPRLRLFAATVIAAEISQRQYGGHTSQGRLQSPHAALIFSWIMFPELCISDPLLKPMDGRSHLARDIPSLRWTKMVIYRDRVTRGISTHPGPEGHRFPRGTRVTLTKF